MQHYDRTTITEALLRQPCFGTYDNSPACRMPGCPDRVKCRERTKERTKIASIIDADQDRHDQMTTRLSLRREMK